MGRDRILKAAVSINLLLFCWSATIFGQTNAKREAGDLFAGIELGTDGLRTVALRFSRGEDEPSLKLLYSENIHLGLGRTSSGKFAPRASEEAAQALQKLLGRLDQQYRVPAERIFLIGSSSLGADHPEDLLGTIAKVTGRTLNFLDVETEVQLSIVGTISRRESIGDTWIDNRNSSVLIEIGSDSTKGGYQLLKYLPSAPPSYDFVTMSIPQGTVSFANEISRANKTVSDLPGFAQKVQGSGAGTLRNALRKECESKPGLVIRKRVYLTGDIVWALATLVYPTDRQNFVPLTPKDITLFAGKMAENPQEMLTPDLSKVTDRDLAQEIERELEAVRNTFTPQQLIAGAELLKTISTELKWQEKKIWFARFGQLGRVLSYVRLQAGK
ncbi:MAG TPA: hypothetical protein VJ302_21675 [Blastocatellia bacterium]|nr:hypothetical protein [Blastocatellia bacterium]